MLEDLVGGTQFFVSEINLGNLRKMGHIMVIPALPAFMDMVSVNGAMCLFGGPIAAKLYEDTAKIVASSPAGTLKQLLEYSADDDDVHFSKLCTKIDISEGLVLVNRHPCNNAHTSIHHQTPLTPFTPLPSLSRDLPATNIAQISGAPTDRHSVVWVGVGNQSRGG